MNKWRKIVITLLIGAAFPLGELHRFWRDDFSQYDIFLGIDLKMDVAWIVKFLSNDVRHLFVALALFLSLGQRRSRLLYALFLTYVIFCGIELGYFFWDFQRNYVLYAAAYVYIAIIFIWYYLFRNEKTNNMG